MKAFLLCHKYGIQLGEKNSPAVLSDFFLSLFPCSLATVKCQYTDYIYNSDFESVKEHSKYLLVYEVKLFRVALEQ